MDTRLFDYDLPPELIAQTPLSSRDESRMMVLCRSTGDISHAMTCDLPSFIRAGEILLLNESRVIPARVCLRKLASGGSVDLLFLNSLGPREWRALARPSGRLRPGTQLVHESEPERIVAVLDERLEKGGWRVRTPEPGGVTGMIQRFGRMPLPPYIDRKGRSEMDKLDRERYQTVYARVEGSVAAPTAGLHITQRMLDDVRSIPALVARCVLHVGLGTFKPVTASQVEEHSMEPEAYEMGDEACGILASAMSEGRRILAVGTTSVRVLEATADAAAAGQKPLSGETSLFITPGYSFKATGALLTNFHLPRSTLLMLVSAFAGMELATKAYKLGVAHGYRFLSYGDAMLIV